LKILLDTTYLLPAVGISIKELSKDALIKLNTKENQIAISQISIFELAAKGAKYVVRGTLSPERVTRGIRALLYDDTVETIPTHETKILLTSFTLRSKLPDFIDCLILSTALNNCDALITEDTAIHDIKKNREYIELISTINPNFKIQKLTETKQ
jgi:PIN domain nuclease of toxin-antitoxin system